MIGRIEATVRRWRRCLSRSEWLTRLLKLSVSSDTENSPGLVMIQIDGLSFDELQQALQRGEMPFLSRLLKKEQYRLHNLYSGVPSTTPAMQGELFYGVRTAVPSFNFMSRESKQLISMYERAAAAHVEQKLAKQTNAALLEGGSCYSDNYTGGAAEPHFCPSSMGWGAALRDTHPLILLFLIISNTLSFVRTALLIFLEILLALLDFIRGIIDGRSVWAELKFVPTRVLIVILLRELITIGVKMDVTRGLPIIHANFLGYDEQAHRRGPKSLFAHWTLKGIDDAIARIWHAAHRSQRRSYDVWVYADHGQQAVQAYEKKYHKNFSKAAADVFSQYLKRPVDYRSSGHRGIQLQRIRMLGGKLTQQLFARLLANIKNTDTPLSTSTDTEQLTIAPLGPIAHLYYNHKLSAQQLSDLAAALVSEAHVPLVLHKHSATSVHATTRAGEYSLAQNPVAVLGAEHPYLEAACKDLIELCHHPDAGVLIACGYTPGGQALSFAIENGAHGGSSIDETSTFALLPADIELTGQHTAPSRKVARPCDLRHAALRFLGRETDGVYCSPIASTKPSPSAKTPSRSQCDNTIRIMTYNVHSCIGMDAKVSPQRIARVIACYKPDIVALQELDVGRPRTHAIDQAHSIARYLEMEFHFHAALHIEEGRYGNAVLTHLPMQLRKAEHLPTLSNRPELEPRGALWVSIDAYGTQLQLINTHLGLRRKERKAQVQHLLSERWLDHPDCQSPVILCGDFNTSPNSNEWHQLHKRLPDAQLRLANHTPKNTFFSRLPSTRIDHVFIDSSIKVLGVETPSSEMVQLASDHLPLIVELNPHRMR